MGIDLVTSGNVPVFFCPLQCDAGSTVITSPVVFRFPLSCSLASSLAVRSALGCFF